MRALACRRESVAQLLIGEKLIFTLSASLLTRLAVRAVRGDGRVASAVQFRLARFNFKCYGM